ncbi:mucin-17-like [Pseudonaja textilis]|uniref:mucin-17-like n=1 Tax=Pseudonaja textilis TaxID=8673 RepID=UPI000EAAA20D|nr:mucin-17-like [Pseudonaja textilis]
MDSERKVPDDLRYNVLQLLINHPNGIKFGDFSAAFYQIHNFHPKFSHYGYCSLRQLLDHMKETVVVEGKRSCGSVMKLVSGLNLDGLLDEIENSGLDSFEEEDSRLKEEKGRERKEDTAASAADLAEVLAGITNLLIKYESGLKIEKIQTLLLSTIGIDLQAFIIAKGYKDILTFLGDQIPKLIIRHRENLHRCVVQLSEDLTVVSVPICDILKLYPDGLKLSKLKEAVKKKCGYDLEVFCYQVGFCNIVSCLQEIPKLIINRNKSRNCRIQLKPGYSSCSSSRSSRSPSDSEQPICTSKKVKQAASEKKPVPFSCSSYQSSYSSSSDSDQSTGTSNNSNEDESEKMPVLGEVMALVTALLSNYEKGLRIFKLQEFLLVKDGIALENFSIAHGYRDTVEFMKKKMPQLVLSCQRDRLNTVAIEPHSALKYVTASLTALLSRYMSGLRVIELQDLFLAEEGFDLEKFSLALGHKDTVEFLEEKMPQLKLNYRTNRLNSIVIKPHSDLEDNSKPASTLDDPSASDSECQNEPASIAVVPPEVNLFHTNQSYPNTMSSNLHESHNTLSVKAKSSSLSSIPSQQPNPCQPSAKSVTEETPASSQVPIFQPSTTLDELKQQVAQILAKYPRGISLFQFRIVYSATFKQHFPVGNASSTKQRLLEMPDTVYIKGHGVQTLLLPVSPDVSPAKPGQPASSKVENVAVVCNLSLVNPEPVTKPAVETFDSHSVLTSPLIPPEKPGSKDCCSSKDLSLNMLLAPCQEQKKAITSLPGFSDQLDLSKVEDIPVLPGHSLPKDESLIIPQSFLMPAIPRAAMMPVSEPPHSFLQYYQSVRIVENKGNNPFTELHTQSTPGSIKVMEMNKSCLNGPDPKLGEIPFIPHCFAALPTYFQGTECGENLQPGILKPRFATPTKSKISDTVPSVDSTPVPSVLVKSEIHPPGGASQSSNSIQPMLPVQPPPPILSTEQRNYNCALLKFDSFSEAQKQSRTLQHFSSPESTAKRSSASSLPRNSANCFPSRSQLNHHLQQPAHARLDDLQSTSVSLADKNLRKASLDSISPVAVYPRKPTYVNPLETSSTTESSIACSVSGSLHTSSVITNNSRASSSVSSRTTAAVSAASLLLDSTANSYDQIAYASAKITSNSTPLFSETQASTQQRQYSRAASTVISNTKTSPTSWSPESNTCSHHQFAYASSRITTNSSNLSSETYQGPSTQASETIISSNTKTASSISSLDSTTSIPCQHAYASAKATSTSSVLSKSTAYQTPISDCKASLSHPPPTQNNLTSSLSKQGDQSSSLQEKQVTHVSKIYDGCLIL